MTPLQNLSPSSIMTMMIDIKDLCKTYANGVEALKGISLSVKKGEFYGLLGPNGAGKSTTIGIISSLVFKDSGTVILNDFDIDQDHSRAKQSLGVVPQEFNFNIFEPCEQILVNQAGYYGVDRKIALKKGHDLLDRLGLGDKKKAPPKALSGGMKRRLMIARALVHSPSILILDEPTAGIDIQLRRQMYDFLNEESKKGLTIVLTTHYLEEAESLCQNIGIIDQGMLIENAPTKDIVAKLHSEAFVLTTSPLPDQLPFAEFDTKIIDNCTMEVTITQDHSITDVVSWLKTQNITVQRLRNKANRLEEIFLKLVTKND